MHLYNFFVCGPKFTRFLLSNLGWDVVDQLNYECGVEVRTKLRFRIVVKLVRHFVYTSGGRSIAKTDQSYIAKPKGTC